MKEISEEQQDKKRKRVLKRKKIKYFLIDMFFIGLVFTPILAIGIPITYFHFVPFGCKPGLHFGLAGIMKHGRYEDSINIGIENYGTVNVYLDKIIIWNYDYSQIFYYEDFRNQYSTYGNYTYQDFPNGLPIDSGTYMGDWDIIMYPGTHSILENWTTKEECYIDICLFFNGIIQHNRIMFWW